MRSLKELRNIDTSKFLKLHETILEQDVHGVVPDYDIYERNNAGDEIIKESMKFLNEDKKQRDSIGGPTVRREKFQANYWKAWNVNKNVLEDISAKEVAEAAKDDAYELKMKRQFQALHRMKDTIKKSQSEFRSRRVFSHKFGSGVLLDSLETKHHSERHTVHRNFVEYVFWNSLHTNSSSDDNETANMIGNKNFETVNNIKGGGLSQAARDAFPASHRSHTSNCDIPPLPSVFTKKFSSGSSTFGASIRFAVAAGHATGHGSAGGSASSGNGGGRENMDMNMGHTFAISPRFKDKPIVKVEVDVANLNSSEKKEGGEGKEEETEKIVKNSLTITVDPNAVPGPGQYNVSMVY
jgi:hypothetical protein